ncbi:MAG TPA: FAD-dependent monooxygenase [Acetobacteraceae bacterium]|nr:FAD-dependent monooxygenase [Acetobacteraceae bacterium]
MRGPLIIGGGPAGAAAACLLAQAGDPVTLLERQRGPADKVCGDFLSAEAVEALQRLGIDLAALHPAPIHAVRLIHNARIAEAPLPFTALGLSRRALDEAILQRAVALGATVHRGCTVSGLAASKDGFAATCGGMGEIGSNSVFLATGKHDLRGLARRRPGGGPVGLKMYYELVDNQRQQLAGAVELVLFPGGYAGLQAVEHGRAVLCLLMQADRFRQAGGQWSVVLAALCAGASHLAQRLRGARAVLPRPLAVAGIPYGHLQPAAGPAGLYRLGDQACVIPSLTGDGVAIALHSAAMAAAAWRGGQGASAYHALLARGLRRQMRTASLLHGLCLAPRLQSVAVMAAGLWPSTVGWGATATRVRSG